jgi:hypothetical protein
MLKDPAWDIFGGWKEKAALELDMVVNVKQALVPCSRADYLAACRLHGKRVELLRILTPAAVKTLADGMPGRHEVRLVVVDINGGAGSTFTGATFSGTVDDGVVRYLSAITLGRPGLRRRMIDVKGAYYEGIVVAPEDGGRVLFAEVPESWSKLGFPEVDCNGDKCYYRILKNIPGRRDAGRIWAQHYDRFLHRQGFTQSIVDLRVFVKHLPHGKQNFHRGSVRGRQLDRLRRRPRVGTFPHRMEARVRGVKQRGRGRERLLWRALRRHARRLPRAVLRKVDPRARGNDSGLPIA